MVVLCRIRTKNVVCLAKKKTAHSFPCKQDHTHFYPHSITDHRAGSVHFNILFIRMYRCALLERWWCAHQPVESHISKSTMASLCHCYACSDYSDMGWKPPRLTYQREAEG